MNNPKMSSSANWAQIGKDLIDEICWRVNLEDLPWDGGNFDIKEFVNRYKEYMKTTKEDKGISS